MCYAAAAAAAEDEGLIWRYLQCHGEREGEGESRGRGRGKIVLNSRIGWKGSNKWTLPT